VHESCTNKQGHTGAVCLPGFIPVLQMSCLGYVLLVPCDSLNGQTCAWGYLLQEHSHYRFAWPLYMWWILYREITNWRTNN